MYYKRISDLKPAGRPINNNWNDISVCSIDDDNDSVSALYAKSLWFSALIAKDKNGKPTGNPENIVKFDNKRINAYQFIKDVVSAYPPPNQSDIETSIFIADILSADNLNLNYLYVKDNISVSEITSKTSNFSKKITLQKNLNNAASITATNINSLDYGEIPHLRGNTFQADNFIFTNLAVNKLTAKSATITSLEAEKLEFDVDKLTFNPSKTKAETLFHKALVLEDGVTLKVKKSSICELFKIDTTISNWESKYTTGTLIRFGKIDETTEPWEVTIAKKTDGNANGVIVANKDEVGIILNNTLDSIGNTVKPVVVLGRAKIKVKGNVQSRGTKLYLSTEEDGVASTTPNGNPVGIALRTKSTDTIDLVDCFIKFNVE